MRRWTHTPRKKTRIEIIPMIDVMMFLLVFFVLISVNVIPALGLKTQLPNSKNAQSIRTPVRQVVVTLGKAGSVQVQGQEVSLGALAQTIRTVAAGAAQVAVVINSDRGAEVQNLVDVMDQLKGQGFASVAVAAREKH
ncbi:MAG: ExbD/TolR family protein [Ramlibacter sp.]